MKAQITLYKNLIIGGLLISAASVSMLTQAAVTLNVDDNIKVTAINGQEVKQSIFQDSAKSFTLQPGQHAITAKYDRLFKLARDEHDYLRSGNISVAAQLADNQTYRLTMLNQPEDYAAAKKYAERPTLAIQQNNTLIASQQSVDGNNGGILAGLGNAIGGVFGGIGNAQLQNQQAIAAIGQPTLQQPARVVQADNTVVASNTYRALPTTTVAANSTAQTSTLDSFMQLWLQATPAEREKIRQWAKR